MRTPLGGVDVFHLVNDRVMRARGVAGNHCLFAVAAEGHIPVRSLTRRLEHAAEVLPELRSRLVRTPVGPAWEAGSPFNVDLRVRSVDEADLDQTLENLVDQRVDGHRPWSATLLRTQSGDVFVWHWFHPLADAKGAERFVTWLGSGDGEVPAPPPAAEVRFDSASRPLSKLDRKAQLQLTRTYGNHMLKHARTPIVSLATLSGRLGHTRALRVVLTQDETKAFDKRVRERAKLAETSAMVLASTRVFDGIARGRGLAPAQHLVPVPLSLDPKAGAVRMFGNNLTMMTFALVRDDLADTARAVQTLADQQRAIVKEKLDTGMLASLDFAKAVPSGLYHWFLTRPFGGEVSSFVFSNPGAVSIASFLGLPVRDAFAFPSVATPPGFQVIFSRYAGKLSAFIGFVEGTLWPAEEQSAAHRLREELLAF
ncbi:MAG: hypothetical protein IPK82_12630 [Polyangiaceae bacterium]|nr:hypothetical protein [Polyangiaceae bacterium]